MRGVEANNPTQALDAHDGQLLPTSESPFVRELRHRVDVAVRAVVLGGTEVGAVCRFVEIHPYDVAVIEHGLSLTTPADPVHHQLAARLTAALD